MSDIDTDDPALARALQGLFRQLPHAKRTDAWFNTLTGMGRALTDKTVHTQPFFAGGLQDPVLADLFHSDSLARRIVTKLPDEALRLSFSVHVPQEMGGHEVATKIQDAADDLDVVQQFRTACYWERLFGGAVLYVALDDGQYALDSQAQPVRLDAIRKVHWVRAIDRTRIRPSMDPADLDADEDSPTYGEPLIYLLDVRMEGVQVRVHRSRLILFPGAVTTDYLRRSRLGWGISVLDPCYEALQRNANAWSASSGAITNAQYVVYKLQGLASMMSQKDGEAKTRARANQIEMAKSIVNGLVIDADDEYIRETPEFGKMPEMLEMSMLDAASAADTPATVLWGRSPAGENATGESDQEIWTNSCDAYREHHLRPRLHEFLTLLMRSKEGPTRGTLPDGWRVYFRPLRQLSELEKADVRLKTSQADASDIDKGVLLPQEVAVSRFRPEGYSVETQIDLETRQRLLEMELAQREEEIREGRAPGMSQDAPELVAQSQVVAERMREEIRRALNEEAPLPEAEGEEGKSSDQEPKAAE